MNNITSKMSAVRMENSIKESGEVKVTGKKKISKASVAGKKLKVDNANSFTIVETFVGAGGSHLGFKNNNFNVVFVNDNWKESLDTLKLNNPELKDKQVICDDITTIAQKDLLSEYNMKAGDLSVLIGGVVCKGFSLAGVRNPYDERNYLYISQLKLVEQFRPVISIIENVPGMKNMKILTKKNFAPVSKKLYTDFDESIEKLCEEIDSVIVNHKNNRGQIMYYRYKSEYPNDINDIIENEHYEHPYEEMAYILSK